MNNKSGISIVEVIIAVSIILTVGVSFAGGLSKSLFISNKALQVSQAAWLLEDSAEAVKTIRDADWANISGLSNNTNYYLVFDTNTNTWSLTQTDPGAIDGVFDRRIVFSSVNRDANDDIAVSGTNDINTKYVNVTISWQVAGININKNVDFYISKIF
jgi:type II secretory pathway pseudopilin PulG